METLNMWKSFNEVSSGVRQQWSEAGELIRKVDHGAGYQSSPVDTFPIKLIFARIEGGGIEYLGVSQAYVDIEKWILSESRQKAFKLLNVKEVFTEELSYHKAV